MPSLIRFNEPYLTGNEQTYIDEVFKQQRFYGCGQFSQKCQEEIARLTGARKVLLTDSCTSALEIMALLLRKTDTIQEVILPSYTFTTTASAFARAGFRLVFAEIDPRTMMLDPGDVEHRISEHTCAVIAVHYGSFSAEIETLSEICDARGLMLLEDAAQGFMGARNNRKLGTFGRLGAFSFHETKNLHAGLCGALLVNDPVFDDRATFIWERGTNRQQVLKGLADKYSWVEIGGSFYPTELQAAFLLAQLEQAEENHQQRRQIFEHYAEELAQARQDEQLWFCEASPSQTLNYHSFWVQFPSEAECDRVREHLNAEQIQAFIGYVPLHSSPVGLSLGNKPEDLPLTESYAKRVLRLPFHNNLTDNDVSRVCETLRSALK